MAVPVSAVRGTVEIRSADYAGPVAQELISGVQQEYLERYGGFDETPVAHGEFSPPHGVFLVGYLDGVPVACGGWRVRGPDAEIKRMYVHPAARRRGLARQMLAELERTAARAGRVRAVLETGWRQPEAISLYTGAGYLPTEKFGHYRDAAGSLCYAKALRSE